MNKMMLALAAICVAGFASAVNIAWSSENKTLAEVNGLDIIPALESSTTSLDSVAFAVTLTLAVDPSTITGNANEIIKFAQYNAGNSFLYLYGSTSGSSGDGADRGKIGMRATQPEPDQWKLVTNDSLAKGDKVHLVFNFEKTDVNQTTMTFYLNGSEVGSMDSFSGMNGLQITLSDLDDLTIHDYAAYTDILTEADIAKMAANGTALPEPTVMALLALGVAGLALRRKAA